MAKSLDAKGMLGKVGNMPAQVTVKKGSGSTKPGKANHKPSMTQGPYGGKKPQS